MDINKPLGKLGLELRRKNHPLRYKDGDFETMNNHDFIYDPQFRQCWAAAMTTVKDNSYFYHYPWRVYVTMWFANQAFKIPGDYIEFGCHQGFMSMAVITKLLLNHEIIRDHFLFDTFNGFDERYVSVAEKHQAHYKDLKAIYRDNWGEVRKSFEKYSNVYLVKGAVPDTLESDAAMAIRDVAFCYIDMNCAAPEKAALEWVWPKLSKGAILMSDDYGEYSLDEQHKMWDEFAASVSHEILPLPTGQGVIIK